MMEFFDKGISDFKDEVHRELDRVGSEAVEVAKSSTAYHDRTGRLRRSNGYKADENGLKIYNDAPYASNVEARCGNVIADAILYAKHELGI